MKVTDYSVKSLKTKNNHFRKIQKILYRIDFFNRMTLASKVCFVITVSNFVMFETSSFFLQLKPIVTFCSLMLKNRGKNFYR